VDGSRPACYASAPGEGVDVFHRKADESGRGYYSMWFEFEQVKGPIPQQPITNDDMVNLEKKLSLQLQMQYNMLVTQTRRCCLILGSSTLMERWPCLSIVNQQQDCEGLVKSLAGFCATGSATGAGRVFRQRRTLPSQQSS